MDSQFRDELNRLGTAVNTGGTASDPAALNAWQKGIEARIAALEEAAKPKATEAPVQGRRINVRDAKDGE